jgi:RNA polymerase sigma-70 factor (ECF subfamily)
MEKTIKDTEIILAKSLKNGNVTAYDTIYRQNYLKLSNYIFKMSKNRSLTEDIVQDSFILLWEKRANINPYFSISSYLFKICQNNFLQHIRKENKYRACLDEIRSTVFYEIYNEDFKNEKIAILKKVIDDLPPKCKEAFVFSKYEKLPYKQIALEMKISIKTVENHISKAYTILRKSLLFSLLSSLF